MAAQRNQQGRAECQGAGGYQGEMVVGARFSGGDGEQEEIEIQRRVGEHPNIVFMREFVETHSQ